MLSNFGTTELIIILVIVVLLFGSKKIVELARGLGESSKELKKVGKEFSNNEDKKDN